MPAIAPADTEFFVIAEAGILEAQALLLCKSVRQFAGAYAASCVTVVSPRKSRRPARETIAKFEANQAEYLELDIDSPCPSYGTSFRIFVASYLEQRPGPSVLVQLDSDTIFVAEPDFSLDGVCAAARPVDVKGMCTEGSGDPFDAYWRDLCGLCEVDYDALGSVTTTVDRRTVRANYNGGLIAVRRSSGIFAKTENFFLRLVKRNLRPWAGHGIAVKSGVGMVDREGSEYWGSSQVTLSLAITSGPLPTQILPDSYNIPLHSFKQLPPRETAPIHVHYHWLGTKGETADNPMLNGRLRLPAEVAQWIRQELPLYVPS